MHLLHQAPPAEDGGQSRWRLRALLHAVQDGFQLHTLSGLCQLLRRLGIHWKRAREHVHSPDPDYRAKLLEVHVLVQVRRPEVACLFEDEFTLYRHPGLAQAYEQVGAPQPLAELGHRGNYTWRFAAVLEVWTGQVIYGQARVMDVTRLIQFYRQVCQAYPGQGVQLIQDNWPLHYHPDVLAALQPQAFPYGVHVPPNWSRTARGVEHLQLPIQIRPLPTYASWTNPIEKLWRKLQQEVLRMHRYEDDWPGLKQRVFQFLDQYSSGSKALLRYVGLEDPTRLYQSLELA